jgi:hypothetical protein
MQSVTSEAARFLQVKATLADNGKVKVEISFDEVRLDDRGSRRVAE